MDTPLQIKNFPSFLRKWLKIKAAQRETNMRQIVIELVSKAHNLDKGAH